MTDLIPRDAAVSAMSGEFNGIDQCENETDKGWWETSGQCNFGAERLGAAIASLRAIPAIDPAAIREAALREAADKLVHVGYPNTDDEADGPVAVILALIQKDNTND